MLKQRAITLVVALALVLILLGGAAASKAAVATNVAPAHHLLACGADGFPPCW